jgi:hypothetical protein
MTETDLQRLWRPLLWFGHVGADSARFDGLFWREALR